MEGGHRNKIEGRKENRKGQRKKRYKTNTDRTKERKA